MELNQLKTFQTIAFHKSFSKAAEELVLTQPAVTSQIKNLESELGEPLIDRLGRAVSLTPAGEAFLVYVQQILSLIEEASGVVRQFSNQRGRLTIGAGYTTTIFRLPDILRQYRLDYPRIEIQVRNGASNLINRLVYENMVDLGLVTTIDLSLNLKTLPVFQDRIWLLAPPDFSAEISAVGLEAEPLILFRTGSGFRRFLDDQFQKNRFQPNISIELESIEAIIRFIHSGLGLAFLPEIAVKDELAQGNLKKVVIKEWGEMFRQTYLIYRRDKYLSWAVKAFLDQLFKIRS